MAIQRDRKDDLFKDKQDGGKCLFCYMAQCSMYPGELSLKCPWGGKIHRYREIYLKNFIGDFDELLGDWIYFLH